MVFYPVSSSPARRAIVPWTIQTPTQTEGESNATATKHRPSREAHPVQRPALREQDLPRPERTHPTRTPIRVRHARGLREPRNRGERRAGHGAAPRDAP